MELGKELNIIGRCPECGQMRIIRTAYGHCCIGKNSRGERCNFRIHDRMHGILLTSKLVKQILDNKRSGVMEMRDIREKPFDAHFEVRNQGVEAEKDFTFLSERCPICGGRIRRTAKGWACENHFRTKDRCSFVVQGMLSHRKLSSPEVESYIRGEREILDGFYADEPGGARRPFSAYLYWDSSRRMTAISTIVGRCPICGGRVLTGMTSFNCENQSSGKCTFTHWRHLMGYTFTQKAEDELLRHGHTLSPVRLYKEDGTTWQRYLSYDFENMRIEQLENIEDHEQE